VTPLDRSQRLQTPSRRVVLLGASNLKIGFSAVVEAVRQAWGVPLDILSAMGHGRSFGLESRVLGRSLPSIVSCGLWDELASRPPASTAALLTDIGNDILYGAPVEQIAGWVETCLERLAGACERLTVTQLPLESIEGLGRIRFLSCRSLLFPGSRLQLEEAIDRAEELNRCVVNLAARFEAQVIAPRREWYGFDPIHIQFRHRKAAWQKIFSVWLDGEKPRRAGATSSRLLVLRRLRPLRRRLFGVEQTHPQPAAKLPDGSTISLY